jgi:hypothetical protein
MMAGTRTSSAAGPALVDEFLESYVFWRESCEDVRAAYERWATCEPAHRDFAFERYRAALDWEERAAQVHADRTARVRAAPLGVRKRAAHGPTTTP